MKFKMIHHVDQETVDQMFENYTPVFVLSTGRSGSKFIVNLLKELPFFSAFHEPHPNLMYFCDYFFHNQDKRELLEKIFLASRFEIILAEYIKGKIYVESNQCLTFLARPISEVFKKAKIVHLVRHPGDFVVSAVRKGWHKNDSIWESGRLRMADQKKWRPLSQIEKLGWVWGETNASLDSLTKNLDADQIFRVKLEELTTSINAVKAFFRFVGLPDFSDLEGEIQRKQALKINELKIHPSEPDTMKKQPDFPKYDKWSNAMKAELAPFVEELALGYGYQL